MLSREILKYYLDGDLEKIQKEATDTILYIQQRTNKIKDNDIVSKLYKLNYYETSYDYFAFKTRSGLKRLVEVDAGGICMPVLEKVDIEIRDIVIIISNEYKNNSLYKIHELLHMLSIKNIILNKRKRDIPCGIDVFKEFAYEDPGIIALNEGITDYFAHEICKEVYSKKFGYYKGASGRMHRYYFSILLISLLCYSEKKKNKLLEAYLTNNKEYVFKELQKCFGRNLEEILYLLERAEIYTKPCTNKNEFIAFRNDLLDIVDYYYDNIYKPNVGENKAFVDDFLSKFEI